MMATRHLHGVVREPRVKTAETTSTPPRERILEAASDLFYRHGVRGVGVDTIIERADVAKMTFYKHFPSKDDLVVAWLNRCDAGWRDWFQQAVESRASDPPARLLALFDVLGEWLAGEGFRGCAFLNTMIEVADREHPAHRAAREHKEMVEVYVRELARQARLADPAAIARQFMLIVDGAILRALLGDKGAVLIARETAERLLECAAYRTD